MKVKIKKLHPDAVIPKYSKDGDAGLDLVAINRFSETKQDLYIEFGTGLSIEIPKGFVGLIFPRSSISNTDLCLANSVGVIDSSYRGEIKVRFKASAEFATFAEEKMNKQMRDAIFYKVGDKIAQLIIMPYPHIEFEEVEELESTDRGNGGFGSTGK